MFCKKCGSLIIPKKVDGKRVLACRNCGVVEKRAKPIVEKNAVEDKIVMVKESFENLPKTKKDCQKCEQKEVYYWITQTRSADESPTKFFRCPKCHHTWREYD